MCRGGTWWQSEESESGKAVAKTAVCRGCGEVTDYSAVFLQEELFLCDACLEQDHADCELGEKICPTCKSLGERLRSRWLRQKGITKVKGDLLSEGRCRWTAMTSRRSPEGSVTGANAYSMRSRVTYCLKEGAGGQQ